MMFAKVYDLQVYAQCLRKETMKPEHELELSPFDELDILMRAKAFRLDPELLRYYVKFGPGAPQPPSLSRQARWWQWRLRRR